jgi:hypothetical protein
MGRAAHEKAKHLANAEPAAQLLQLLERLAGKKDK